MTLIEYLKKRNKHANALTKAEAKLLHLNYPLDKGWVKLYGDTEIDDELLKKLNDARSKRYGQKSYKKAKAKSQRKGRTKNNNNDFGKVTSNDIKLMEDALNKLKSAHYKVDNGLPRSNNSDDYRVIHRDEYKILQEAKKRLD